MCFLACLLSTFRWVEDKNETRTAEDEDAHQLSFINSSPFNDFEQERKKGSRFNLFHHLLLLVFYLKKSKLRTKSTTSTTIVHHTYSKGKEHNLSYTHFQVVLAWWRSMMKTKRNERTKKSFVAAMCCCCLILMYFLWKYHAREKMRIVAIPAPV